MAYWAGGNKLDEVFRVADRATVLRDGKYTGCEEIKNLAEASLVKMMAGRSVEYLALNEVSYTGGKLLEVKNITKRGNFGNIPIDLHRGDILAITGLVGSGRIETVKAVCGLNKPHSGEILLHGKSVQLHSVISTLKNRIAFVPEDRHEEGLISKFNIPLLIATLGINSMLRGLLLIATNGSEPCLPSWFVAIGKPQDGFPRTVLYGVLIYVLGLLALRYTSFGRAVYAYGCQTSGHASVWAARLRSHTQCRACAVALPG